MARLVAAVANHVFTAAPATPPTVMQGSLEMSNVSSVEQMVRLITVLRVYQELTQGLQLDDQTKNLATSNVGLVS